MRILNVCLPPLARFGADMTSRARCWVATCGTTDLLATCYVVTVQTCSRTRR